MGAKRNTMKNINVDIQKYAEQQTSMACDTHGITRLVMCMVLPKWSHFWRTRSFTKSFAPLQQCNATHRTQIAVLYAACPHIDQTPEVLTSPPPRPP